MARYHPLYEGFWDEPKLDGCSLEQRGFAAYLFSNHRVRPSGIYRASPAQLAADVGIPTERVIDFLSDLDLRRFLVVDNLWIFVVGYLNLQPKQARLMLGVRSDVKDCSSKKVLAAFHKKYPWVRRWSPDRHGTVTDESVTLAKEQAPQSSSRAVAVPEQSRAVPTRAREHAPPGAAPPATNPEEVTLATGSDSDTPGNDHHPPTRYDGIVATLREQHPDWPEPRVLSEALGALSHALAAERRA